MTPINISDCPETGLKRKITNYNLLIYQEYNQIILDCTIKHYKNNGNLIENNRIKSYTRKLVASDSLVRNTDGYVLTKEEIDIYNQTLSDIETFDSRHAAWVINHQNWLTIPEGPLKPAEPIEPILPETPNYSLMKEYDFYRFILGINPVLVFNLCEQIIQIRDAEGKFDI